MNGYLTPEIGKAVAQLAESCDSLTRQVLIRALTQQTQEWCEGDPELAETILDGKKTLEGCVKYVLEQAALVVAKSVAAMPKQELDALPVQMIGGKKATMAGGVVGADQAFGWAKDYYYKVKESDANAGKSKGGQTGQKKKSSGKSKKEPKAGTAAKGTDDPAPQADQGESENRSAQLSLFSEAPAA